MEALTLLSNVCRRDADTGCRVACRIAGFAAMVTTDQEIPFQQNLNIRRRISMVVLCAPTNGLARLSQFEGLREGKHPGISKGFSKVFTTKGGERERRWEQAEAARRER